MGSQRFADFVDGVDQCVTELLVPEMVAHFLDQTLPQFVATFLVNRFVSKDCELVRTWRNENQNRVPFWRLMHSELAKFYLCCRQRVVFQLTALNEDTDLAGSFRFGVADRLHDLVVLEPTEKFFSSAWRLPTSA